MREAIGASIRQAKHQLVKLDRIQLELSNMDNHHIVDENDVEEINEDNESDVEEIDEDDDTMMDVQKRYPNNNDSCECSADELDYRMDQ